MADTVLGAIIGVVAMLLGAVVTHVLSLREDEVKRERDAEQQRIREVRESLRNVSGDRLEDATRVARIAAGDRSLSVGPSAGEVIITGDASTVQPEEKPEEAGEPEEPDE